MLIDLDAEFVNRGGFDGKLEFLSKVCYHLDCMRTVLGDTMNPDFIRSEGSGVLVVDELVAGVVNNAFITREW